MVAEAHARFPASRRGGVVVLFALLLVLVSAAPALAHSRAEIASNFDSRITAEPDLPGVSWSVLAGGDLLEVRNDSASDFVVLGYEGEPYLRVGPEGVFVNRNSPATYLNEERYANVAVPPRADAAAAPEWARVSDEAQHAWHDHRVHWMAQQRPAVAQGATEPVRIQDWSIPLLVDGNELALNGELWWVPRSLPWGWMLLAALLTAPALAGLRHREANAQMLVRPAAAVVVIVAVVNTFLIIDELTWPSALLDQLFGAFHQVLFIATGIAGAVLAWRGRGGPFLVLGIASGALLFHQGLLPIRLLWTAQLPTVWPPGVLRALVAVSLMQALWVGVVIAVGLRSQPGRAAAEPITADAPQADAPERTRDGRPSPAGPTASRNVGSPA